MTIVPTFTSPCDLAVRIPDMIASFFQLDIGQGKRFREESATDVIVASLLQLGMRDVVVVMPNERATGSDFDITVVNPKTSDAVQFRIQAKRLTVHLGDWKLSSYRELAHPNGTGGQASTLIRSSAHEKIKTIPLYAFYNPTWICNESGGSISGVELASGHAVSRIVKTLLSSKPRRPPLKRIDHLRHLFFPFSKILCHSTVPPSAEFRIASPLVIRESVEATMAERDASYFNQAPEAVVNPKLIPQPDVLDDDARIEYEAGPAREKTLPLVVRRALERSHSTSIMKGAVKRPKVILIASER